MFVELEEVARGAVWIDGYRPDRMMLNRLVETSSMREYEKVLRRIPGVGDDKVFYQVMNEIVLRIAQSRSLEDYWEDIFYLDPNTKGAARFRRRFPHLYHEIKIDKNKRNRQIVGVYRTSHFHEPGQRIDRLKDAYDLTVSCSFSVKPSCDYENSQDTEKEAKQLLELILLPFEAPCAVATATLSNLALGVEHFTV